MSSIVINGDTSGSVTLQAPAIAGSTVVTLPTTSMNIGTGGGSVATNTAFGTSALAANTTGSTNTAVGYQAGLSNTTGASNTALGQQALRSNTTASGAVAVGHQAGYSQTTASSAYPNTYVGQAAGYTNITGLGNTGIGSFSLTNNTADNNTGLGSLALTANTTGAQNVAVGSFALYQNTTGGDNTALGQGAMGANTTGASNTAVGKSALLANTTASRNTAVGYVSATTITTGTRNTALGAYSLFSNTTGNYNTAVGDIALYTTTGSYNTAIGLGAGELITTGSKNTIIGCYNGNQGSLDIRTASNYIVLSDGDGNPRAYWNGNDLTSAGYISNKGLQTIANSSGTLGRLGYITTNSAFQVSFDSATAGVQLSSGATSWGTFSDERLKNVTGTYTNALSDIAQIQPVKFTWKSDAENKPQVGVIAQSVQAVVPEAIDSATAEMDGNTEYLQVRYTELIPLMIAAIQEQQALITTLTTRITALEAKVGA